MCLCKFRLPKAAVSFTWHMIINKNFIFASIHISICSIYSLLIKLCIDKKLFDSIWIFSQASKSCKKIAVSKFSLIYIIRLNFSFKNFTFSSTVSKTFNIFCLKKRNIFKKCSVLAIICKLCINKRFFYRRKCIICKIKI
jgi:hypothetical protein